MAEDKPSLHVDTDWKKQAQQEKKRLAEEEQKRAAAAPPPRGVPAGVSIGPMGVAPMDVPVPPGAAAPAGEPRAAAAGRSPAAARGRRELPSASFATLIQSLMTQTMFYLGELAPQGGEPMVNLDMAKHQIDLLGLLEEKTVNNLTEDEKHLLDAALYETRTRYVQVASQYL